MHKSGEKNYPNNYRGITLPNCLEKLFNTILYKRLKKDIEKQKIFSLAQCRFRKNHRTTDAFFTLFNLIKKHQKW